MIMAKKMCIRDRNDVYLGDNTHIENCIVESRDTIRANSYYCGEDGVKVVVEKNERYVI